MQLLQPACPKQTVPQKRFMRYNLTRNSHFVPDKTFKQDEIFCNDETTHLQTFPRKARQECNYVDTIPPRELRHYSRRHLLISRLRTSFRGVMDGREAEGLKRRKKLEDVDAAEESEASRLSIQARYFMASGEPRSMR